jgi:hypothetical protein
VDHTIHLAVKDSLEAVDCRAIKEAVGKAHNVVEIMKESSLKKEAFIQIMEDSGEEPLAIIQGTRNR